MFQSSNICVPICLCVFVWLVVYRYAVVGSNKRYDDDIMFPVCLQVKSVPLGVLLGSALHVEVNVVYLINTKTIFV